MRRQDAEEAAGGASPEEGAAEGGEGQDQPQEQPQQQQPQQQQPQQQQQGPPPTSATRTGRAQARLTAAVERVGGPEVIQEALSPKPRAEGETSPKWSAVCCERAEGLPPGDPVFLAWARLAVTPVREIKSAIGSDDRPQGRGRGRGRGGPRRGRDDGYRGDGGAAREDVQTHGRDGRLRSRVRIIGLDDDSRDERGEIRDVSGDPD